MRPSRAALAAAALMLLASRAALGQQRPDSEAGRGQVTRPALDSILRELDQNAQSTAYSSALRAQSRREAALIRARLEQGDFQVGDRIRLTVEGEPALTDTFRVEGGRVLNLPSIGAVPLAGVLRSELTAHLTEYVGRFVRNPVVHARSLIRLTVVGGVLRPGYYTVPTEALMEDVLMLAGGPVPIARLTETRVERGKEILWEGDVLQQAIAQGRTVDALNLQAGDRIVVPQGPAVTGVASTETWVRIITAVITLPIAIYGLTRLF